MEENKQVVATWRQENKARLSEIKTFNPDLYSAINMALNYLNKTLTGEELPVEVEEEIVEPQQTKELSVLDVASVSTLSDFYNTKINVKNEEQSRKFQELIFALGGGWESSGKILDALDEKYFYIDNYGHITFGTTEEYFNEEKSKEIFYNDIFKLEESPVQNHSSQQPSSTTSEKSEWRLKTKEELESEFGTSFDRFGISEDEISKWYGKNLSQIYTAYKYSDVKEAEDSLLITDNINLGDTGLQLPNTYFTKDISTSSQTSAYKLPIDTYPVTLKHNYSFFSSNDGSRLSPTQSAGDLKRMVMPMGADEVQEIRKTFFRGNDGMWYEINVGKGGTWTWKKLNPVENWEIENKFQDNKPASTTSSSVQSTPTQATATQKRAPSFYDLVGRKLDWNGSIYEVVKLRKINPKNVVYDLRNKIGGVDTVNIPKSVVLALLTQDNIVAGVKLLPKEQQVNENDYSKMSDIELKSLAKDTQEARDSFEFDEPEYAELTTQVGLMIDEMKRRNIL
jgi:hypothetical protein